MTHWQDRPPETNEFAGIRIARVPPNKVWDGLITSETLVGCYTHYHHRRTVPCDAPDCPVCAEGVPARWHGYLSYYSPTSHRHIVVELTALACEPIIAYQDRHQSIRGAKLTLQRIGHAPNSPVQAAINAADTDNRTLPAPIDIRAFLTTIWRLGDAAAPAPTPSPTQQLLRERAKRPTNPSRNGH